MLVGGVVAEKDSCLLMEIHMILKLHPEIPYVRSGRSSDRSSNKDRRSYDCMVCRLRAAKGAARAT